ncbi:TadE/TadG family type IV pilus assembly protein [Desertibaculum subflavum]|uniref:TadE/TadG family type IV pilus assembly protein n=1 Tax=Desertibaculum subflavum TaxID=2268458 RepID=UPI000E664493
MKPFAQLKAALRCRRGVVAIEFAAMMPILALLLIGVFEVTRYMIAIQKVDRIAVAMADYVSQAQSITQAELNDLFSAVSNISSPVSFDSGIVIVSSVYKPSAAQPAQIVWQRQGGGTLSTTSHLGAQGGTATLPTGMTLVTQEGMVAAEAIMDFEPVLLQAFVAPIRIYRTAFYRPRKSNQVAISGN